MENEVVCTLSKAYRPPGGGSSLYLALNQEQRLHLSSVSGASGG